MGQGTIVDRIDYNIQNVSSTVEDGLKQLQKVNHYLTWVYTISLSQWFIMFNGIALWNSTGGTYTEEWWYGYVCVCSCYPLLHHDSSLNPQGDFLVTQERDWPLSLFYSFIMGTPQCLRCSLFCCIDQNCLKINSNCVLSCIWILKSLFINVYLHVKKI